MATIEYKPGASGPLVIRFEDDSGGAITYGRAQIRIQLAHACLTSEGVLATEDWEFDLEQHALSLPQYRASAYYDAGEGWRLAGSFFINVLGGC